MLISVASSPKACIRSVYGVDDNMIGNNMKKTTIWGGLFSALFLCALMALMPFSSVVAPASETDYTNESEMAEEKADPFHLPEQIEPVNWEYGLENELEGMRNWNQKAFAQDGEIKLLTSSDPLHYADNGVWKDIDVNIKANAHGWEVTENKFETYFPADVGAGVVIKLDPNEDPLVTGIAPQVVTLDTHGEHPMIYRAAPSHDAISVGGNAIRYPVAQDFDLDYEVTSSGVKQNLIIRAQPTVEEIDHWFGLREMMRLPAGYALFIGDQMVENEILTTNGTMSIRNIETGYEIGEIPPPVVFEAGADEPYIATFFVSVEDGFVFITTAVETSWLMDENRTFPLSLDPSVTQTGLTGSDRGGYCQTYRNWCYTSDTRRFYRYYGSIYNLPWSQYQFTSSNNLPTGATATGTVKWVQYVQYHYSYGTSNYDVKVLKSCGSDVRYNYQVTTRTCTSTSLGSSDLVGQGTDWSNTYLTKTSKMVSSIWNSPSVGTLTTGTGWKTVTLTAGGATDVISALTNNSAIAMGYMNSNNNYISQYSNHAGANNGYLEITYTGGSDTTPPSSEFIPYESKSYAEGARTFFTTLSDPVGIDTTSSGKPHLYYSVNGGAYSSVAATSIGTCSKDCRFKATTASISTGDSVDYFWAFQDLAGTAGMNPNGNNFATDPVGGTGSSSSASAPSTPYNFEVEDVTNAGDAKKFVVLTTDVYAGSNYNQGQGGYFDRQMTYYDDNDEFIFEFDTSNCGTAYSTHCFYTTTSLTNYYSNWITQWTTSPHYSQFGGTQSGKTYQHKDVGGYITVSGNNGPGMSLIYHYDNSSNDWGVVGLGTATGIAEKLSGGDTKTHRSTYGQTKAWTIELDKDMNGTVGHFDFNGTYASSRANWMCVGSNGFYSFFRSNSANPSCSSGYYYVYHQNYRWTGFALSSGGYGRMASSGVMSYKVSKVAPAPDTFDPEVVHSTMMDSHSRDRTFSFEISDGGEPPSGLNTSTAPGIGPTLYYTITDADGNVGTQQTKVLSPDDTRSNCVVDKCEWTASLSDIERGSSVSYYIHAQDISTAASGVNVLQTTAATFEVAWPKKVFIVEWHDLGYNQNYQCNVQARLYDTTNEIEFHYDPDCEVYYDYATVGYQDQTRTKGDTLRPELGYMGATSKGVGGNPHDVNYRIFTDSNNHGWESFDTGGFTELVNYKTAIVGTSGGGANLRTCSYNYLWVNNMASCDANIDMPDDFTFEYFGTTYNGTVSTNKVMLSRFGGMYFSQTASTAPVRGMTTWWSNMPDLPIGATGNAVSRPGLIAPWWGGYNSYTCYDTTSVDCSVRYRTMPFEGRGTDIDADITTDTSWDLIDSPIRINPSGDYLSINANLNIEEGVVVQVAQGKGISFDGSCDRMTLQGNSGTNSSTGDSNGILFEGQNQQSWKGISFTGSCSTPTQTDDRHVFNYTTFANTTDYAISAGSRHGSSPSSNSNVGNFTMRHVAFKNVGGAISHGSGQGTAFAISNFEVSDASDSCFSFPAGSDVSLTEGEMDGCNSGNDPIGGAVTSDSSGSGGSLFMENVSITDAQKNVVLTKLSDVTLRNVSAIWSGTTNGHHDILHRGSGHLELTNFTSDDYPYSESHAMPFVLDDVDVESSISLYPGGSSSNTNGPSGFDASLTDVSANGLNVARSAITGSDIDLNGGDLLFSGNSPSTDTHKISDLMAGGIGISGCGFNYYLSNVDLNDTSDTAYVSSSCSSSAAPNTLVLNEASIATSLSSNNIVYARNSKVSLGNTDITGQTALGNYVAKSETNGIISLIDVTWRGNDCTSTDGSWAGNTVCWVAITMSSGQVNFGGTGTVVTYKEKAGVRINKGGIAVSTYTPPDDVHGDYIGTQVTDGSGEAEVWILTTELSGSSLTSQTVSGVYFDASGPAGMNSTLNVTFAIGNTTHLRLSQPPIALSDSGMDCLYLSQNESMKDRDEFDDGLGAGTFLIDDGVISIQDDLHLDGCSIKLTESAKFIVSGDATISPVLTISNGGSLILESGSELKAGLGIYPVHLVIGSGGTLSLDASYVKQIWQDSSDSSAMGAIILDKGATLVMINGSVAYGDTANSKDMATVMVNGGTFTAENSSVVNSDGTGTGVWFKGTTTALKNLTVTSAARGIMCKNAAPTVNGFTLIDNDVGVEFEGGMSLPSIFRSTILSGEATGWTTHAIDLSAQVDSDKQYMQVGFNSIYGGGNAHPRYNYYTQKYYMMYDRMRYEVTLDDGTQFNYSYDQAGKDSAGYWSDSSSDNSDYSGWGRYDCNYYGYSRNPASSTYNYMYYLARYASHYGSNGNYDYPDNFGFRFEDAGDVSAGTITYPYMYWGLYYRSYHAMYSSTYTPPEGFNGLWGNYNVCANYAYNNPYYISSGKGARVAMPILDLENIGTNSGTSGNIQTVTLYIDVLHNRADYYQDRIDIVSRTSDDHNVMGDWQRESGTPSFTDGTISGADVGIEIAGGSAAGDVQNVTVNSPTTSGVEITGASSMSFEDLTVNNGENGIKVTYTGRGKANLNNIALNNQNNAGILYQKDVSGDLSGTITGSAGAAIEYGWLTNTDRSFENLHLGGNAIGIETAGSGDLELVDSNFTNTVDFKITGSSVVDFVDGTVDDSTVAVTGNGEFKRARSLDAIITADSNALDEVDVYLIDGSSKLTGSGETDSTGVAQGLRYYTSIVNKNGLTNPSLSGYKLGVAAKVGSYSASVGDFRYYYDSVTLDANAPSTESVDLVNKFDARVCYSFSSTSYTMLAQCASGSPYLSTSGSRTLSCGTGCSITEYGYYGGVVSNMNNKAIMVDAPLMYIDGGTNKNEWNNSVVIMTGSYSFYGGTAWRATYPYNAKLYVDNSDFIAMSGTQQDGDANGFQLGYYSWSDVNPWYKNSRFIGLSTIAAANENGNWMPDHFVVVNNTIVSNTRVIPGITALTNDEYCVHNGGVNDAEITGNKFYDCAVSVRAWRGNTWGISASNYGADDMLIEDNLFHNGVYDIWFGSLSYADDTIVRNNTHTGSGISSYGIYAQDYRTTGTLIEGNTIENAEEAIYLRGALDFEIIDNTITGLASAADAGIYVRNGYGEIDGNTLVDADGGILVDGIRYGYDISVTNNTISSSSGRTAVGAVGIWAEDCGSSTFTSGGNTITLMANAIVTDGCDIEDSGSNLIGTGGTGSMVYTVNMMSTYFSPQNVTITEGDSIRWRLKEYAPGSNYQHSSVSNDTASGAPLWDSTPLNLGSTYTRQFNTAGTYDYHCGQHPSSMFGTITVEAAGSGSSTYYSTGFDVAGSNDDVVLNGTSITGFTTAYEQIGGSLSLIGNAMLSADDYGADLDNVDVSSDGASLVTTSATGVGIYFTGGGSLNLVNLSTDSARGIHIDGETDGDFDWNGGTISSGTGLYAEDKAIGDIQNMTWSDADVQIYAGDNTKITSVGNTLDLNKISVSSSGEIYEANLLDLDVTHTASAISNVGLLIQSEGGSNVAYVSPDMRSDAISVDTAGDEGDLSDWTGNEKNPADDARPGVVSSDGAGEDFMVTWDQTNLYLALTGVDMNAGELLIFIDSASQGSTSGWEWDGTTPTFNHAADYAFWAENGDTSPNEGVTSYTWGLRKFSDPNWVADSCQNMQAFIGWSENTNTEVKIPWSCIGSPADGDKVRLSAVVLGENDGIIASSHPSTGHIKLTLGQASLSDGTLDDKRLNYREFIGSTTPSAADEYTVTVKVDAPDGCEDDWGVLADLDMSENRDKSINIVRACPVISGISDVEYDEDSGAHTISLTDKADDLQDAAADLTWTYADDYSTNEASLLSVSLSGHELTITPADDQFGTYLIDLTVEDSHGLTNSVTFKVTVNNVNDKPIICNSARSDCILELSGSEQFDNLNMLDEGWVATKKTLGSTISSPFITDQYNEQNQTLANSEDVPQIYTWGATVDENCIAFTVEVSLNELWINESMENELGGVCTITMSLSDGASVNDAADTVDVSFTINPVNDVPVILPYLIAGDSYITDGTGESVPTPWSVTVLEDTGCEDGECVNTDELTFNLSRMKQDNDHYHEDLSWTWEELSSSCDVDKYFESIEIVGDHIKFTLIQDATTNAPPEEKDYLDDNGIHQEPPPSMDEYCAISLTLSDTEDEPSYIPNYNLASANYKQESTEKLFKIKVDNTPEKVADYLFDVDEGINFNSVQFIMPGTHVPVDVTVKHEGDEGPYKYDQLLKVSFLSDGAEGLTVRDTYYVVPPAYGKSEELTSKVLIEETTTRIGARVDVMTCKAEACPSPSAATPSDFISNVPPAHQAEATLSPWSSPGTVGYSTATDVYSQRRPALEDQNWLNNVMFTSTIDSDPDGILDSGQELPVMVDTISPASVPSFAPGFAAISAAGLFVAGLMLASSRRRMDEEELEALSMVDDEQAVSPVIATILMVAITVVLSGVVYVWASDLADQPSKSVPRIGFKVEKVDPGTNGYWSIQVTSAKEPIATQATVVMVEWVNASGSQIESFRLDNTEGVYGFAPVNSDSFVTFSDSIVCDSATECTSTFGDGDAIHISMTDSSGELLTEGVRVTLKYVPVGLGTASVLKTWNLEI